MIRAALLTTALTIFAACCIAVGVPARLVGAVAVAAAVAGASPRLARLAEPPPDGPWLNIEP